MDPFRLCLSIGPVTIYLLLLGLINLGRRPLLVSGGRDTAALALAVSGWVIIGPIELFFPFEAAIRFGPVVWVLLVALYCFCILLCLLSLRPRMVVYNISLENFRSVLANVAQELNAGAQWAGDSLILHDLGVQLYVDAFAPMRTVSLVSAGGRQSRAGWRRLAVALDAALASEKSVPNPRGVVLLSFALLGFFFIVLNISKNPDLAARSLFNVIQESMKILGIQ